MIRPKILNMEIKQSSTTHKNGKPFTLHNHFNVDDSTALDRLAILESDYTRGVEATVHVQYANGGDVKYLYSFETDEGRASLYREALVNTSAGKFAQWVRDNADSVFKIEGEDGKFLPARKHLVA